MPSHWSDAYIGRAYIDVEFDCAELSRLVQAEVFHRVIALPTERTYRGLTGPAKVRAMRDQLAACKDDYGVRTSAPVDGDAALIRSRGRIDHIGTYCLIGGEPWVLHAAAGINQVIRTRVRDLELYGYALEGYYTWK
jgi:hypothetical protein